jgi:hypothetical protein
VKAHFARGNSILRVRNDGGRDFAAAEEKNAEQTLFGAQLRKIKDVYCLRPGKKSDVMYHAWIEEQRPHIMPSRPLNGRILRPQMSPGLFTVHDT